MLNVCAITISSLSRGLPRPSSQQPLSWKCYPLAMVQPNQWICLISRSAACFAFWMFWENRFILFADEYRFFAQEHHNNTTASKQKSLKMYLHSYLTIYTFNHCVVCRIFCSPICRTVKRDDVLQTHPLFFLYCTNGFKKISGCLTKLLTVFYEAPK